MNFIAFFIYCVIVTITPGPTNIAILSIAHNFKIKKTFRFVFGVTAAMGILLTICCLKPCACGHCAEMMYFNLDHVLRLDDLCREFDMSKFQFIRAFKANTGISPYQFFLNCKVEHAKQLIEKNKDIYLAVTECGFVDLTHLNKHFKSVYGITAFEYLSGII